jgi:hypothetical protein
VTLPAGNARNIHMFYIVGGAPHPAGGTWAPDDTVPFARSQALANLMGLKVVTTTEVFTEPADTGAQVRLNSGVHGSYLDPDPAVAPAVFNEMQTQIADFLANEGTQVTVTNPTVIAP